MREGLTSMGAEVGLQRFLPGEHPGAELALDGRRGHGPLFDQPRDHVGTGSAAFVFGAVVEVAASSRA